MFSECCLPERHRVSRHFDSMHDFLDLNTIMYSIDELCPFAYDILETFN